MYDKISAITIPHYLFELALFRHHIVIVISISGRNAMERFPHYRITAPDGFS